VKPCCTAPRGEGQGPRPHHRRRPDREPAAGAAEGSRAQHRSPRLALPPLFDWLQQQGNIEDAEMYRVFNCGIGMVIVPANEAKARAVELRARREPCLAIGGAPRGDGAAVVADTDRMKRIVILISGGAATWRRCSRHGCLRDRAP
jgi:hypothetical protein